MFSCLVSDVSCFGLALQLSGSGGAFVIQPLNPQPETSASGLQRRCGLRGLEGQDSHTPGFVKGPGFRAWGLGFRV